MYHRVAEVASDPWGLAVSPANFASQLELLSRTRRVMPLDQLARDMIAGNPAADAIAISFDDGYADNLHTALPLLERFDLAATFFVTTDPVGSGRSFWSDRLTALILERREPLDLAVDGVSGIDRVRFGAREPGDGDPRWRALRPPRTARQRSYVALWRALRTQAGDTRDRVLAALEDADPDHSLSSGSPLDQGEFQRLASHPLADIGGHSAGHPDLRALAADQQLHEIMRGKTQLELWCGHPITGFAYPHGCYDDTSRALVEECGFAWACTTVGSSVGPKVDRYAIPRLTIGNVDALGLQRVLGSY